VWAVYESDVGVSFALRVDADYAQAAERGWTTNGVQALEPYPRAWLARRVIGIDDSGRRQSAVVASVNALLWNGQSSSFSIFGSDGIEYVCTVIEFLQERTEPAP